MTATWFSGMPAASASVECGGETHTVQWRDGGFHIPAHGDPPDLEAERALAALAGEPCRCLELFDAWERHAADPQVLVLGPRGHEALGAGRWPCVPAAPVHRRLQPRQSHPAPVIPVEPPAASGLEALLALEDPIPRRLVATVATALLQRTPEPEVAEALHGALYGRLLAALAVWRASVPRLELTVSEHAPALTQTADGAFHARLSPRWLTEVWGRDLDIVGDELTLSAAPSPGGGFALISVDPIMTVHTRTIAPA